MATASDETYVYEARTMFADGGVEAPPRIRYRSLRTERSQGGAERTRESTRERSKCTWYVLYVVWNRTQLVSFIFSTRPQCITGMEGGGSKYITFHV